jgi:hypothetical protein
MTLLNSPGGAEAMKSDNAFVFEDIVAARFVREQQKANCREPRRCREAV